MTGVRQSRWLTAVGLAVVGLAVGTSCAKPRITRHYTLVYPVPEARFGEPFPHVVRVKDLDIRPTYRDTKIVFREDQHEIAFRRRQRWSERPQRMISELVRRHVRASGLVAQVTDRVGVTPPDFVLSGQIDALEELVVGDEKQAHLAITLRLQRFGDEAEVWRRAIDARVVVEGASVRGVARALSDLLERELDAAVDDLARHFSGEPPPTPEVAPELEPFTGPELDVWRPDPGSSLNRHPQLLRDDAPMPVGRGAIFLPALSRPGLEPVVEVLDGDESVAVGPMGRRLVLPPGHYKVRFGSGAVARQQVLRVDVEVGRVTVVEPEWSALQIDVVDPQFISFRGSYELIAVSTREDLGFGFGADAQLGEELRTWVLPPGLYKIVQVGGNYRDRTNFATVRLMPGALTRYTLVVDPETADFRGAGVADDIDDDDRADDIWTLHAVLGGDVKFNRGGNREVEDAGWDLDVDVFFDGRIQLETGPHLAVSHLEIEQEHTRPDSLERFNSRTDRLYSHNIYIYRLVPWFGPYGRIGLETSMFARYEEFDEPRFVREPNGGGIFTPVSDQPQDRAKFGGALSPVRLTEGVGGNFRVLRTRWIDLDMRVGLGARQTYQHELFGLTTSEVDAEDGTRQKVADLSPLPDIFLEGFEGAVIATARPTKRITLSSNLDGLLPFDGAERLDYTWRNAASLRLSSFSSLVYRLNIDRDPAPDLPKATAAEHDVQLRFSFTLF